jgi:hypothetical protein
MTSVREMVPGAGVEPAWRFKVPRDFKSLVSTNFTIRASKGATRITRKDLIVRGWRRGSESNRSTRLCRLSVGFVKHIVTKYFHSSYHSGAHGRCVTTSATQLVTAPSPPRLGIERGIASREFDLHRHIDSQAEAFDDPARPMSGYCTQRYRRGEP